MFFKDLAHALYSKLSWRIAALIHGHINKGAK